MKIAIIDDDPAVCGMLQELLEISGHEVSIYSNPWNLLMTLFKCDPPILLFDAMIVDILLPDLPGSQVIQYIREYFADLPIVVVSALPSRSLESLYNKYKVLTVLKKPFALRELQAVLERVCGSTQQVAPPAF